MIPIYRVEEIQKESVLDRRADAAQVEQTVSDIIRNVREKGDAALLSYTKTFDKADLQTLEVTKQEIDDAFSKVDDAFQGIMQSALQNIRAFHSRQKRSDFVVNEQNGVVLGQKIRGVERAGLYVPGGTAAYPSSVLMNCVPAKIAGVGEIIMTTPPNPDGSVNPAILVAAKLAGVDRIFKVGGAQAIAAMAIGTQSVPKADKIVGPGNVYVAEAKRQVYGLVDIDMIAGPSEILVIADATCNPKYVAADLLSQAEHDKMASAVLITTSEELAKKVQTQIETQLPQLLRQEIARASIDNKGKIIVTDSIEQAIEIANDIAPEHLELCVDNPFDYLNEIKHAGSIFLGKNCPEALGDYFAGPNHTLPTSGTARFSSPLSVDDFVKKSQFIYYAKGALQNVYKDVACFAEHEGLTAHAKSATVRFEDVEQ